jgi:protein TonB
MEAARKWKFNAGLRNGQPVGGVVLVPVKFNPP